MDGVPTFTKGICPKVNVIMKLEFELAYYDSVIHCFNHYTTRTTPSFCWLNSLINSSCKISMLTTKFMINISNFSSIKCLCDMTDVYFNKLKSINSSYLVMSFVYSFSNSLYLDVAFNQYTFYIIERVGSCLVSLNFFLLAATSLSLIVYLLNYSNNRFISSFF